MHCILRSKTVPQMNLIIGGFRNCFKHFEPSPISINIPLSGFYGLRKVSGHKIILLIDVYNLFQVCNETGKSYKFSELRDVSHRLAQALRNRLGLKRGDILAIMSPNVPDFCTVVLACLEAGIVVTTLNPIYTTGKKD